MYEVNRLVEVLNSSNNIVFFGGAGVSTASGIPDFRSSNGLFNEKLNTTFTPEQLVSHSFYIKYTEDFYTYYKAKLVYPRSKPNNAHIALAKLEKIGKLRAIVTQNIDGLHQMTGSKNVFELHGSVHRNYCTKCNAFYDADFILQSEGIPYCTKCGAVVKPDVVLYEESLNQDVISGAISAIADADTLIIGGTSLVVYPAAGFIDYFTGRNLVLINKSTTPADSKADLVINGSIDKVLIDAVNLIMPYKC